MKHIFRWTNTNKTLTTCNGTIILYCMPVHTTEISCSYGICTINYYSYMNGLAPYIKSRAHLKSLYLSSGVRRVFFAFWVLHWFCCSDKPFTLKMQRQSYFCIVGSSMAYHKCISAVIYKVLPHCYEAFFGYLCHVNYVDAEQSSKYSGTLQFFKILIIIGILSGNWM